MFIVSLSEAPPYLNAVQHTPLVVGWRVGAYSPTLPRGGGGAAEGSSYRYTVAGMHLPFGAYVISIARHCEQASVPATLLSVCISWKIYLLICMDLYT
jgi:hypothetical protein